MISFITQRGHGTFFHLVKKKKKKETLTAKKRKTLKKQFVISVLDLFLVFFFPSLSSYKNTFRNEQQAHMAVYNAHYTVNINIIMETMIKVNIFAPLTRSTYKTKITSAFCCPPKRVKLFAIKINV